jgi:hypothetical protein
MRAAPLTAIVIPMIMALNPISAVADDTKSYPRVDASISIEVQNDNTYKSQDNDAELNDLFTTTEPEVTFHFNRQLSLLVHGVLEPVKDPGPLDDRYFEDHGFYLEEIKLQYDADWIFGFGGKFAPNFGLAWDTAPGVYGTDFAEDYEFAENIGFGGGLVYASDSVGTHTVSASTFFQDYSILSDSAITRRGRTRVGDGGVGNTGDFASFAVSVDGAEIPFAPGFAYHAAFIQRGKGKGDTEDEKGLVFSGSYTVELQGVTVTPLVEYAHFFDADGVNDQERGFLTTAVQLEWQSWNLALSRTSRDTNRPNDSDIDDALYQVSAGYSFDFGLTADVGWKIADEEGVESQTIGFLLTYARDFTAP